MISEEILDTVIIVKFVNTENPSVKASLKVILE